MGLSSRGSEAGLARGSRLGYFSSQDMLKRRTFARMICRLAAALVVLMALFSSVQVQAAPEAKLLRIDPRASLEDGAPILTTVIELSQTKRVTSITSRCGLTVTAVWPTQRCVSMRYTSR